MIKVLMIEDHLSYIEGLTKCFINDDEVRIVDYALNKKEAFAKLEKEQPDAVILDMQFEDDERAGEDILVNIKEKYSGLGVLILTSFNDKDLIISLINKGADGFRVKNTSYLDIKQAIIKIYNGYNDIVFTGYEKKEKIPPIENERDKEVLKHLCKGLEYKQIADKMNISVSTVRDILQKLRKRFKGISKNYFF